MIVGSHTSVSFCASIFGLCDYPAVRPYTIDFPKPLPPANATRPQATGRETVKFVQFSDIHVDLSYEAGANYNCTKPLCCRPYTPADAPGNTSYPAGPYGNHQCDSPLSLEESMYAAINELVPDSEFVLFTGDIVEGAVWLVTETENTGDIIDAYQNRMKPAFPLVYGTAGNHEAAPVNAFPPNTVQTNMTSQWVYDTLASMWTSWIGSAAATSTVEQFGAYSTNYSSSLRIISLNSNFYYNKNFWLFSTVMARDPDGQFAWLVSELQSAEDAGQRVYILAHMPMGSSSALFDGSHYFDTIVNRYQATIAAMFFGHTHQDQFELSYSNYQAQTAANAVAMSYIAPAMTPTSGHPSFRVYEVDAETWGVLDFTEYYANTSAPDYQTSGPTWQKLYSAKDAYGSLLPNPVTDPAAELTPAFWHNVTELFEADDAVFQDYFARKSRGYSAATCTGACKESEICQLRAADAQYNCVVLKPGLNFKKKRAMEKREGEVRPEELHVDECDLPVAAGMFAKVLGEKELLTRAVGMIQAGAGK